MVQSHQLHLLLLVLIPIQHCGGGLIDLEDIIYQFLLRNCSIDERLVTYYVVGDSQIRGFDPVKDFVNYPPVTMEVGPVIYGEAQVHLLQLSAVYVQIFHNNQTGVVGKAHISEEVLHEDEYMWTVNKGLDFTSKVKFTVNVPLVYQFSSEISTSVKTGSGSTTVETRTTKQLIKQDVIIPPGATLEAKWYVNEAQVVVPWESNITLSGYIMASIVYLGETWVNAGHTKQFVWQDKTVESSQDAFLKGSTTGLAAPSGKGGRLILVHAGSSETGFVEGAADFFRAKKGNTADYHSEMDGTYFEGWFSSQLLPKIPPRSIIVMDNVPYHSVALEKAPTSSTRKADIQAWVTKKGISWSGDMVRAELLELSKKVNTPGTVYRIDTLAAAHSHKVLRLPPYHSEFNPIELVWSKVKRYGASKNKLFTLQEVERLLPEALASVTQEDW
ncbi:uncharacterized protein ISCGN_019206 [Ixodes scapularis]